MSERLRTIIGLARDRDGPRSFRIVIVDVASGQKYLWAASSAAAGGASASASASGLPSKADIAAFVAGVREGSATGVGLKAPVA